MKYAVNTWSFQSCFEDGSLNQLSCMQVAKDLGFDGIEFTDVVPHDGSSKTDYAKRLRDESARLDLPIINLCLSADFINGSDGDTQAEIARVQSLIDLAAVLGSPKVRHDATAGFKPETRGYKGFAEALVIIAPACRAVSEYAADFGIQTMVENHGYFCQDSDRVEALVNRVACDNFGLLVDIGNFLCADEDPTLAVARTAPYAFHAHAKDFHIKSSTAPDPGEGYFLSRAGNRLRGAIIGHGDANAKASLIALQKAGYDGYLSIEFEGLEAPALALKIGLANLKQYCND